MFEKARLKLTLWYLLIIMLISGVFSVILYDGATREIHRIIHIQELRRASPLPPDFFQPQIRVFVPTADDIEETENRLKIILIIVNAGILVLAGAAGYFLAGRTLMPIKTMLEEQNRFISDASHELRTPITAMRTETEVALRDKNLTLNQAKQILESNLEEAVGIQVLSNSLLRLTHAQDPSSRSPMDKVSLKEAAMDALKKIKPLAKARKITLKSGLVEVNVKGVRQNLTELIIILLDNAIKYSPASSIVEIKIVRTDGKASLSIADEGIGISKKDIPNIFNRFYRAEKSRSKQDVDGFGLGLSIAKKIVAEHNGTITVKSDPEKGSVFTITFPVQV